MSTFQGATAPASADSAPIGLSDWEGRMRSYGTSLCRRLKDKSLPFEEKLAATYYDAQWVFFQIADYTGDTRWYDCAEAAERVYRDAYVLANDGKVPGYWNFTHGLAQDFLRTGDPDSKKAAILLATDAPFAVDSTPLESTRSVDQSREVAYIIMAYLNAEDLGAARRPRLTLLMDQALGHMDQWFVSHNAPYVRPFMVALTAQALISYDERTPDPRILPALKKAAEWLWEHTWNESAMAFQYTDRAVASGGTEPSPDLNLLIAPLYAWLYKQTGDNHFREQGDKIFHGGVRGAFLNNGKQFNQSYRWSFDYLRWR